MPLDSALAYAGEGWLVFPVWGTSAVGQCGCGRVPCDSAGKHPHGGLAPNGLKDATLSPERIRAWWREPHNIGIVCGEASGLVVLDIDTKRGGGYALEALDLPETITAKTGSGGAHYYYAYPKGLRIPSGVDRLGVGIDVRATGGYVVAPPSTHASGARYQWQLAPGDVPLAPLPEAICQRLTAPEHQSTASAEGAPIPKGGRNQVLFGLAVELRRRGCDPATISAVLHGQNASRCVPLLPNRDVDGIVARVSQYEPVDPLLLHPELMVAAWKSLGRQAPDLEYQVVVSRFLGDAEPPPESDEWWVEGLIPKAAPFVLAGPPKSAKTITMLDLAVSMALGAEWAGHFATKPCKVFVLPLEDPRHVTQRRLWRILRAKGAVPGDVDGLLAVDSDKPFRFDDPKTIVALRRTIEAFHPDVVIVDSLSRAFFGEENSKAGMGVAIQPWQELVREYGISIGCIHHLTKSKHDTAGETIPIGMRLRGSGDLFAFVRLLIGMEKIPNIPRASSVVVEGNYEIRPDPFCVKVHEVGSNSGQCLRIDYHGDPVRLAETDTETRIMVELLGGPMAVADLTAALHVRKTAVLNAVRCLETQRLVERESPKGKVFLATPKTEF